MKKKLLILLSMVMMLFTITGCDFLGSEPTETPDKRLVNITIPDGITAISCAKLVKEDKSSDANYEVKYNIEKTSENVVSSVLKGEADIAIVPSNVSATQYNKTGEYKIAATIGWGSFYLESTSNEKTIDELKGKEIYNIGKGLTPDAVMKSILKDKGYNADSDFNFSYVNGVTELAPMVISSKAPYAVLPEPALSLVMSKNKNVNIIMDLNSEWKKLNNSDYGYPQSTLIVKKDFYEDNKDYVNKLLNEFKDSCEFAANKDSSLPDYCEEIGVSTDKNVILTSMDKANISYTPIKDCYKEYNIYFQKLFDFDKTTIGGNVPDENIFLEK